LVVQTGFCTHYVMLKANLDIQDHHVLGTENPN